MTYVVIGSAILMTVLQTMCIHMIANVVLKRMHIETRAMKSIFEIKVPKSVGYTIIMIWVLFLVRNVLKLNPRCLWAITRCLWSSENLCNRLWCYDLALYPIVVS